MMTVKDFIEASNEQVDVHFDLISNDGWINSDLNREAALAQNDFVKQAKVSAWMLVKKEDSYNTTVLVLFDAGINDIVPT